MLNGDDTVRDEMTEREQQYYLAVYKTREEMELYCNNSFKLFLFADVHCKTSNDTLEEHKQWCHEITFVYGGEGKISHNGKLHDIKSGQIHLCFDEDSHRIIPSKSSPLRFYCLAFTLGENNPLSLLLEEVRHSINEENAVLCDCADLHAAFKEVLYALHTKEKNEVTTAIVTGSVHYILSAVFNRFLRIKTVKPQNISMQESLLFYVISYLKNNVYHIDALSRLSADMGYSYSYLSHLFSEKMGQSLKSFFMSIRMDAADKLLEEKTISETSDLLGYSSVHAFTRAYKNVRHTFPSATRRKYKQ